MFHTLQRLKSLNRQLRLHDLELEVNLRLRISMAPESVLVCNLSFRLSSGLYVGVIIGILDRQFYTMDFLDLIQSFGVFLTFKAFK